jgi:hypothetical protein
LVKDPETGEMVQGKIASYPMVSLNSTGHIPMVGDDIVFDGGRLSAAKAYAVKNDEGPDMLNKIDDAREDFNEMKSEEVDTDGDGVPDSADADPSNALVF